MTTFSMKKSPDLVDSVGAYYADLDGFIDFAYPWLETNSPLEAFDGPERWVREVADDISNQIVINKFDGSTPVPVIQVGVASGNGCAKSTFAAMLVDWIMSTRAMCQGTVIANTGTQLRTKTWPQIIKWTQYCITRDWFNMKAESMTHVDHGALWATNMVTWSMQNPQAIAGQHARESSSFYIADEASNIPESIFDSIDGGLTDGEPFLFLFGNPMNRGGRLFRSVFGNLQNSFIHKSVDSRDCKFTNKPQIDKWIAERGEDSDWIRAHVKGLPPNADELQFIDNERVQEAQRREVIQSDQNDPLVMSIDFARGGSAFNVIGFRRGRDARSIPRKRIPGEKTRDTTLMTSMIVEMIETFKPDAVFGDATGIGGPIMDRLRQLVKNVPIIDVINAGASPDERYGNVRAYCWAKMKEWLVGAAIERDDKVELDLTGPGFYHNQSDKLMIESKDDMLERGLASPDDGDQMAMTFAVPVRSKQKKAVKVPANVGVRLGAANGSGRGWMRR